MSTIGVYGESQPPPAKVAPPGFATGVVGVGGGQEAVVKEADDAETDGDGGGSGDGDEEEEDEEDDEAKLRSFLQTAVKLKAKQVDKYTDMFTDNEIDLETLEDLMSTEQGVQDLKELGVTIGMKNKLAKAFAARNQRRRRHRHWHHSLDHTNPRSFLGHSSLVTPRSSLLIPNGPLDHTNPRSSSHLIRSALVCVSFFTKFLPLNQ